MRRPRLVSTLAAVCMTTACSEHAASPNSPPTVSPQTAGETVVYDCPSNAGDFRMVTRSGPDALAIWLPPRFNRPYLVLGRVEAASGARYEGDGVSLWSKGNEALLEVDGETLRGCAENRYESIWEHAKLSGVDFRGVGNEPGWVLEIRNADSIRFSYDYGQSQITVPAPAPDTDQANRSTTWKASSDAGEFQVTVQGTTCEDTMSDHRFSARVTVRLGEREFHGCGRALH